MIKPNQIKDAKYVFDYDNQNYLVLGDSKKGSYGTPMHLVNKTTGKQSKFHPFDNVNKYQKAMANKIWP